jgi:hypothetical protein
MGNFLSGSATVGSLRAICLFISQNAMHSKYVTLMAKITVKYFIANIVVNFDIRKEFLKYYQKIDEYFWFFINFLQIPTDK